MDDIQKPRLPMLPTFDEGLPIKPVFDPSTNMLHYQTDPYQDSDGIIKIKRIVSFPVTIEKAFHLLEEYTTTTK